MRALRAALGRGVRFAGQYATWAQAERRSQGYESPEIAKRVLGAELEVKKGAAADARDGVAFAEMQFELPVMAALARAAAGRDGTLQVLDIGGAFGRLYRQCKIFLPGIRVSWLVLEQSDYVALGRQHFQSAELRFADDLGEATAHPVDVLLFCSVLQYIPDPYALIERALASRPRHVIVDRTPCTAAERDVVCVQRVPAAIYAASYPCWIFSRQRLASAFAERYVTVSAFTDGSGAWRAGASRFELCGFLFDRRAL
jgi:putative methyltransferase (TIGR04325 family)